MYSKERELSILVVGKSGAGKSEFIGSFAQNNKLINSSGMGQTTRTSIEYNFFINKEIIPEVQVKVLTEEEFVNKRMEKLQDIKAPIKKYDAPIKGEVLDIKGFFNYKEFDFDGKFYSKQIDMLWDSCFTKEYEKDDFSKEEFLSFKANIKRVLIEELNIQLDKNDIFNKKNYDKNSYKLTDIVEIILHAVYKICKKAIEDYPERFLLSNLSELDYKRLTYCLKVDKKHSVTGLISKVIINDRICSEYEEILKRLKIDKITFIDTYGLDHEEALDDSLLRKRYQALFNEYPQIDTVLFVRALGSDAPTDLSRAIPLIYETNPSAVPYIVYSKIDENSIIQGISNKDKINLVELNEREEIKAVNYFIDLKNSNKIKSILDSANVPEVLIESRYSVLVGNLIPYCSKYNSEYIVNNKYYVKKLFKSILNKEHLGKHQININSLMDIDKNTKSMQILCRLLKSMFCEASKDWSGVASRTSGANRKRLEAGELGYDGTYSDTWSSRFYLAYNNVFSKISDEDFEGLFKVNPNTNERIALQELLNRFSKYLLGCSRSNQYRFINKVSCGKCQCEDECYKTIILKSNPKYKENEKKFKCNKKPIYSWLTEVYNFVGYFEEVSDEICNSFIDKFKTDFIYECRQHNARVIAESINENAVAEKVCSSIHNYFKEYYDKYDNVRDEEKKKEFEKVCNSYVRELKY